MYTELFFKAELSTAKRATYSVAMQERGRDLLFVIALKFCIEYRSLCEIYLHHKHK